MHKPVSHRSGQRRDSRDDRDCREYRKCRDPSDCRHAGPRPLRALGLLAACAAAALLAAPAPAPAQAASIYLCKTHGGATFWSSAHCRQHDALIDRIESVPDGLPFDQQVALAEQSRAAAARLYQAPATSPRGTSTHSTTATTTTVNGQGKAQECKALEAHITQLDAQARQPQTAQTQDWLRSQKQKARDRQFQLRC
jgi:hypothetical protein